MRSYLILGFLAATVFLGEKIAETAVIRAAIGNTVFINDSVVMSCNGTDKKCSNTRECIDALLICDGNDNCIDKSDELNCAEFKCADRWVKCGDGLQCILEGLRCDGNATDCQDGSDEDNCTGICGEGNDTLTTFKCADGHGCYRKERKCDGKIDCQDGSDEDEDTCRAFVCGNGTMKCNDGLQCIDIKHKCDGINAECNDKSDEDVMTCTKYDCGQNRIKCKDGLQCIDNTAKCDGYEGCNDLSDELNCPSEINCGYGQIRCDDRAQCVAASLMCDGNRNCNDGSEELGCASYNCSRGSKDQVKCADGLQCIYEDMKCNRFNNCNDKSDEANCGYTTTSAPSTTRKYSKHIEENGSVFLHVPGVLISILVVVTSLVFMRV